MTWSAYTQTMQQLAALRRSNDQTSQQHQQSLQAAHAELQQLTGRLATQKTRLSTLAVSLQLPASWLDGVQPSTVSNIGEALSAAKTASDQTETHMQQAEQLAMQPPLLPRASPSGRAALVYGSWALIGWLAQCGLVLVSGTELGAALWSLCGLPALVFFAGFLTLTLFGHPRAGPKIPYSLRLGGAICFIGMPVLWVILLAAYTFART